MAMCSWPSTRDAICLLIALARSIFAVLLTGGSLAEAAYVCRCFTRILYSMALSLRVSPFGKFLTLVQPLMPLVEQLLPLFLGLPSSDEQPRRRCSSFNFVDKDGEIRMARFVHFARSFSILHESNLKLKRLDLLYWLWPLAGSYTISDYRQ